MPVSLKDPLAKAAAAEFERQVNVLRTDFLGLSKIRVTCRIGEKFYFDLLTQAVEVTLTPAVEPIFEVGCTRPSTDTIQGGVPWVCEHHPWPRCEEGRHLAPLLQINLSQLRPHVELGFPDLLVQVWGRNWDLHVRTVPLDHAKACQCAGQRESYEGTTVWFKSRLGMVAEEDGGDGPFFERPEPDNPNSIVGFRFGRLDRGEISVLQQLIWAGQNVAYHDDFSSFDAETIDAAGELGKEMAFNAALENLSKILPTSHARGAFPVGSFFRFPSACQNSEIIDELAEGWRPLFCCDYNDEGLHFRSFLELYISFRQIDGEFEFMAGMLTTRLF